MSVFTVLLLIVLVPIEVALLVGVIALGIRIGIRPLYKQK
jgi:hypothetical protein